MTTKTQQIKADIAAAVAEEMIKTKRTPWDSGLLNGSFNARNWGTEKAYRGINRLILAFFGTSETAEYMTFLQAKAAHGKVKKGAKSLPVVLDRIGILRKSAKQRTATIRTFAALS